MSLYPWCGSDRDRPGYGDPDEFDEEPASIAQELQPEIPKVWDPEQERCKF